jgi:hypothetical protein
MRVSGCCCCCWRYHVKEGNFEGYLCYESTRSEIKIDDALRGTTRSLHSNYLPRQTPCIRLDPLQSTNKLRMQLFSKTPPSMLGKDFHAIHHNIGSPIKHFPANRVLSSFYSRHITLGSYRPRYVMAMVLIGWRLDVKWPTHQPVAMNRGPCMVWAHAVRSTYRSHY